MPLCPSVCCVAILSPRSSCESALLVCRIRLLGAMNCLRGYEHDAQNTILVGAPP
ncbi:hypothetical protein CERZMDRAFT_112196 [Cercospora zeae-maydis SCOH1-5]|uniref:Uncharacterized protein n=1 Tax=Cercospora zeae-maydis SCOH1-5 TaxID=717836 RepID=A0A6A6FEU4_9PEZI|nr:hypothetical protein CERZMDRAFT_112196 [Cercospora zeae-maydis SCOH1-5]